MQLLLSVRLAFVENQETGPKLPLIFDEALAMSDDDRASRIAQAVVQICKTGRQVFYFTAQQDEVDKMEKCVDEEHNLGRDITMTKINLDNRARLT